MYEERYKNQAKQLACEVGINMDLAYTVSSKIPDNDFAYHILNVLYELRCALSDISIRAKTLRTKYNSHKDCTISFEKFAIKELLAPHFEDKTLIDILCETEKDVLIIYNWLAGF